MALDKLVDSSQLDGALVATANVIRSKTGESEDLTWDMDEGFADAVGDIVTLDEGTADANATAGDILSGKTAYVQGEKITGTIGTIVGATNITGTTTKKPSIAKVATPSGVTNAASGNATTSAPYSGVYVAVKSNANTGTLTATPAVTESGYGTASSHGITANTATVGASASDTTYVPIQTTSVYVSGNTVTYGSGWIDAGSDEIISPTIVSGTVEKITGTDDDWNLTLT